MVFGVRYLHILHGHHIHAALGPPVCTLGAEGVHDDDGFEDGRLAFLAYLEECFCFDLTVAKDGGDGRWRYQNERLTGTCTKMGRKKLALPNLMTCLEIIR